MMDLVKARYTKEKIYHFAKLGDNSNFCNQRWKKKRFNDGVFRELKLAAPLAFLHKVVLDGMSRWKIDLNHQALLFFFPDTPPTALSPPFHAGIDREDILHTSARLLSPWTAPGCFLYLLLTLFVQHTARALAPH